eukprot:2900006-Amphidinium_carterae.1
MEVRSLVEQRNETTKVVLVLVCLALLAPLPVARSEGQKLFLLTSWKRMALEGGRQIHLCYSWEL